MADAIVDRLLAAANQRNKTVYEVVDGEWKVLRAWVKDTHTISTMAAVAEVKYLDKVFFGSLRQPEVVTETGLEVHQLNTPLPQGTGASERIGNHVQMTGVRIGAVFFPVQTSPVLVRMCVLRVPGIGAGTQYPPPLSDVFKVPAATPSIASLMAPRTLETQKSSGQLLYDNTFVLSVAEGETALRKFLIEIDLDAKVLFKSNVADAITTNGVVLFIQCAGTQHNHGADYALLSRVTYTDS